MYKHVKEMWTAALRSGEFKQVRGALFRDDGYCCLGVLCELYQRETGNKVNMSAGFPPLRVAEWAGVDLDDQHFFGGGTFTISVSVTRLMSTGVDTLNDRYGFLFPEIADVIDAHIIAIDAQDVADPDNSKEPAPISTAQLAGYLTQATPVV